MAQTSDTCCSQLKVAALDVQLADERTRGAGVERGTSALEQWNQRNRPRPPSLVETRGIGTPVCFGAAEEASPRWQRHLQTYVISVFSDLKELMEGAVNQANSIFVADLDNAHGEHAAEEKTSYRAAVPAGASTGIYETLEIRDDPHPP